MQNEYKKRVCLFLVVFFSAFFSFLFSAPYSLLISPFSFILHNLTKSAIFKVWFFFGNFYEQNHIECHLYAKECKIYLIWKIIHMLLMNIDLIMAETDSITSFTALLLHNRCARNWRLKDDLPEKVGKSPVKFSLGLVSGTFVKSSRVEGVGIDRLTGCLPALFQNLSTMTMKSYIITTYTMSTMATMALLFTISNHIFFSMNIVHVAPKYY